jgi:mono/diheme cytochrome c family protein
LITAPGSPEKSYRIPFPFSALVERIQSELGNTEFAGGTRMAMIPMGRSLQRVAAAPDFFKHPRIVFAVTGEPADSHNKPGLLLKDRLYIGYVEKTNMLEVISYNEAAGRYEFQLVKDYRTGAQPQVYYVNRAICIACHQNHAPIFSKAVWSESNANGRMADLLGQARTDFYAQHPQANIDFPDDIGQSSIRANALVMQQALWQRGCEIPGEPVRSRRCRAAAVVGIMQQALSGEAAFAAGALNYHDDFVSSFAAVWRQRWPQGFNIAQAELPDRSPLGGSASYGGAGSEIAVSDFLAAANVPAALDPLNPRAPRETWRFAGALDASRVIQGWTRAFASSDYRALDAQLLQLGRAEHVASTQHQAACTLKPNPHSPYALKIECSGGDSPAALELRGQLAPNGSGLVDWVNLGPGGQLREAQLEVADLKNDASHFVLHGAIKRKGLTGRLANGRSIAEVSLRWPSSAGGDLRAGTPAQVQVTIMDDFALLRGAVEALLNEQPALFDNAPLQRAPLLRSLFAKLERGANPSTQLGRSEWCCSDSAHFPPAALESVDGGTHNAGLSEAMRSLYHNCAACHLSAERFPPNFLAGDPERVEANLRHCAPRMLVRLNAWSQTPDQRAKSPMPPPTFLPVLDTTTEHFAASDELKSLRSYVESLLKSQQQPTQVEELLKTGYEALPSCLLPHTPAPHQASK